MKKLKQTKLKVILNSENKRSEKRNDTIILNSKESQNINFNYEEILF
jgi:hypothetical protein